MTMQLSERDLRILQLLADGYRPQEIARTVFLSFRTIEGRLLRYKSAFSCRTTAQLIAHALRRGWIH